jgi:hypothetical protein
MTPTKLYSKQYDSYCIWNGTAYENDGKVAGAYFYGLEKAKNNGFEPIKENTMKQFRTLVKGVELDLSNCDLEDLDFIIKVKPKNSMGYDFVGSFVGIKDGKILFQQFKDDKDSIFDVEWGEVNKKDRPKILKYLNK